MRKFVFIICLLSMVTLFCDRIDPLAATVGSLNVQFIFPPSKEGLLKSEEITIDRIDIMIRDSHNKILFDQELSLTNNFFVGEFRLVVGKDYSLVAICYQTDVAIYVGSKQQISISANDITEIQIQMVEAMQMIYITGGAFQMGDAFGDGDTDEKPIHTVTVNAFYLGKTEVTVGQYRAFCIATGRSMPGGPSWGWIENHPMVDVSWSDASAFCIWSGGRLPTEAEWEYAARDRGSNWKWASTNDQKNLSVYAWFWDNGAGKTHPVATKLPNGLGLYDMSGNVWEICEDYYQSDYYKTSPNLNPLNSTYSDHHVIRGGSWCNIAWSARTTHRGGSNPDKRPDYIGFRVARSVQ